MNKRDAEEERAYREHYNDCETCNGFELCNAGLKLWKMARYHLASGEVEAEQADGFYRDENY